MDELFKPKISYKQRYAHESAIARYRNEEFISILLDSSLIFQTNKKRVDLKVIDCGDYRHIYFYKDFKLKKNKDLDRLKDINQVCVKICNETIKSDNKKNSKNTTIELKEIEQKNINRSKFEMQRLIKTNEKEFKTFITLTFAENITDIKEANKQFNIWRTYIKKIKSDFKCIGVPEFQKRGAVHYHLLSNIDYNDFSLLSQEERKIYNKKSGWQIGRDIKGWKYGHNMVKDMKDINVIAYLTKYMTKDIDNRLWGHRRYFYTRNLKKPITYDIDLTDLEDFKKYVNILTNDFNIEYTSNYTDFLNHDVTFIEFKRNDNECLN